MSEGMRRACELATDDGYPRGRAVSGVRPVALRRQRPAGRGWVWVDLVLLVVAGAVTLLVVLL